MEAISQIKGVAARQPFFIFANVAQSGILETNPAYPFFPGLNIWSKLMSFLKKLFGGGSAPTEAAPEMHEGFIITPTPMAEGGQYRLCAEIRKEVDGVMKTHRLIRADIFASADQANQAAISKAKQVIKEQGTRIFG